MKKRSRSTLQYNICQICSNVKSHSTFKKFLNKTQTAKCDLFEFLVNEEWWSKNIGNQSNTRIPTKCRKCGNQTSFSLSNIYSGSFGCKKCTSSSYRLTLTEFLKRAFEAHKSIFVYDINEEWWVENYKQFHYTLIPIICKKHGVFYQTACNHTSLTGLGPQGCPRCSESRGEKRVRECLESYKLIFEQEYKFDDCINPETNFPLRFDFYITELNLIIEYDGRLHYEPISHFGGDEMLLIRQQLDQIKDQYCVVKDIQLIRIPYWDIEEIPKIIGKIIEGEGED